MAESNSVPVRLPSSTPLDRMANAAAAISILSELRGHLQDAKHMQSSEHFEWFAEHYGCAIAAAVEALAKSIEFEVDVVETAEQAAALAELT
jgi:hypothetical protein